MQRCTAYLVTKKIRCLIVGQNSYNTKNNENRIPTEEQLENNLICSKWEEAIIREQRTPDISIELMQEQTIKEILSSKQHSNPNKTLHSSH